MEIVGLETFLVGGAQAGREDSQIRLIENLGKRFVTGSDLFKIEGLAREYALMIVIAGIHIVLYHTLLQ